MGDTTNESPEQAPTTTSHCARSTGLLAEVSTVNLWCSLRGHLDVEVAAAAFDAAAART